MRMYDMSPEKKTERVSSRLRYSTLKRLQAEQAQAGMRSRSDFVEILLLEALRAREAARAKEDPVRA